MSVRNTPGAIALTLTPCGAHSTASARVIRRSADLLATYAATSCNPTNDDNEPMAMMRPDPRLTISPPNTWQLRNMPVMLVSITRSQSASLISSVGTRLVVPAAYTMMSSRPKVSTQASLTRSSSDVSATSAGTRRVRRPRPSISAATASTFAARRPVTTTSAPASARPRAMARPMPLVPPTTTARRRRDRTVWSSRTRLVRGGTPPVPRRRWRRGPRLGLLRLILACLNQMRADQRAGVLGMSLADGVEDPLVHARRVFQVPEAGARDHAPPPLVIEHRHHPTSDATIGSPDAAAIARWKLMSCTRKR